MHGVHGRRRAGSGESFWQFRPFAAGEAANRIDWRRSARDDARLYVREREWEAAHTVWIWIDRSASMRFGSTLAAGTKIERALVLGLAAADLIVRGGERVGMPGLTRPLATRAIIDRLAEAIVAAEARPGPAPDLPPAQALGARARAVLIGDFLSPPDEIEAVVAGMSAAGARGHLVTVADPVEDSFPFSGHTEFRDVEGGARLRIGEAQGLREEYRRRLLAHREAIRRVAAARGWTCLHHRTDRPAAEALLAVRMRLEEEGSN